MSIIIQRIAILPGVGLFLSAHHALGLDGPALGSFSETTPAMMLISRSPDSTLKATDNP